MAASESALEKLARLRPGCSVIDRAARAELAWDQAEAGLVAEWQQHPLEFAQLAAPAGWPSGTPYKRSFLPDPLGQPAGQSSPVATAPGAQPWLARDVQPPAQTVSAAPPLPPKVDLPTPAELRKFAATLKSDGAPHQQLDVHLPAARLHLESAAEKLTMPGASPTSALMSLRSAQMAIQDEWRQRVLASHPNIAVVFSPATPPALQSEARQQANANLAAAEAMQKAAQTVAEFIDRIRRAWFGAAGMLNETSGGGLAGQPNARL